MSSSDNIFQINNIGRAKILYDSRLIAEPSLLIFDHEQLSAENMVVGQAPGRGASCFFSYAGREWVLRHFRRGGWVSRFVDDLYLGIRPEASRAFREFRLLAAMLNEGLPVPRPVAAAFWSHGLCHRLDLVTERIPSARPLADRLAEEPLNNDAWRLVGTTLRQFHLKGIYHADLNARNILIDDEGIVYLIDFDRGCQRTGGGWQEANLKRLLRSLHKFQQNMQLFHFHMDDWQELLQGYESVSKSI